MAYIYNETLSWLIDGVNVEFTTLNNINKIEEVYLGWAAYRDVTFVQDTNVVTFADAPPIWANSPTIDYFDEEVVPPAANGDVTFGDIIDDTYDKIGAKRTSNVYLENQIKRQINKGFKRMKNIKSYKDRIGQYTFNKAEDQEAIGYNASSVTTVNSDYVPASGAIMVGNTSFSEYTTYINGVYGVDAWYVYESGDRVTTWYKLPSWVKRPSEVLSDRTVLTYVDNREFFNVPWHYNYTIFKGASGEEYIFMPFNAQSKVVTVKYTATSDVLVEDEDLISIPYEYSDTLSLYAAYNVLLLREDDRWQAIKQEWRELLKDYKSYESRAVDGINNRFGTTPLVRGRQIVRRSTFL